MKRIILVLILGLVAALGAVVTNPAPAEAKGCNGQAGCRWMMNESQWYTPNVVDLGVQIKCGSPTVYWLFEFENTGSICPGTSMVTAIQSQIGHYFACWNGSLGWVNFGHPDGTWHNLGAGTAVSWYCHRITTNGNPG